MEKKNPVLKSLIIEKSDDLFDYYRRPGIIEGRDGALIIYYEGQRIRNGRKQALFMRISLDGGETWSNRQTIAEGGDTGMLHNLMMVYAGGRYHCLWNVQYRQLWYRSSEDGFHWSLPRDLTRSLWRADCDYEWNAFGIGSGHCTQLKNGRILIPTWFTAGGDSHKPSAFGNIYTDDLFETIHIGTTLPSCQTIKNPNEAALAELENGDVLATIRHDNDIRARAFAVSAGGIEPWREIAFREDLPDPICHASMLGIGKDILFVNCANADPEWRRKHEAGEIRYLWSNDARKNLTLRISRDAGAHFSGGVCIAEKGGYCDIARTGDRVVCLYETGWNEQETCIFPHELHVSIVPMVLLAQEGQDV